MLEINKRTSANFGTGLPFFDTLNKQTRFNTKRGSYIMGFLKVPFTSFPTFQIKVADDIDTVHIFDKDDNFFTSVNVGSDYTTDQVIKKPTSDSKFIYISRDQGKGVNLQGIYYIGLRVSSDPMGEYRYYSDQFEGLASPCTLNNPQPA